MLAAFGSRTHWASLTISTAILGRPILRRPANISKPPTSWASFHAVQEQPADRTAAAFVSDSIPRRQGRLSLPWRNFISPEDGDARAGITNL
jgi:hypothetical protein